MSLGEFWRKFSCRLQAVPARTSKWGGSLMGACFLKPSWKLCSVHFCGSSMLNLPDPMKQQWVHYAYRIWLIYWEYTVRICTIITAILSVNTLDSWKNAPDVTWTWNLNLFVCKFRCCWSFPRSHLCQPFRLQPWLHIWPNKCRGVFETNVKGRQVAHILEWSWM